MDQQVIVLFLTAVTAIASLGAAWGAWRSSWATRLTAEAALCTGFLEKYVSKEMLDALWLLSNLKRERVVGQFADLRKVTVSSMDEQRRCLIHYRHQLTLWTLPFLFNRLFSRILGGLERGFVLGG